MTPREFVFYLQGYLDLNSVMEENHKGLTPSQVNILKEQMATIEGKPKTYSNVSFDDDDI